MIINRAGSRGESTDQHASSIGASWPAQYDPHNSRMKGFYLRVIDSPAFLEAALHEVEQGRRQSRAGRSTIRAVCTPNAFRGGKDLMAPDRMHQEAAIPLNNAVAPESTLVYFGKNETERRSPSRILQEERAFANRLMAEQGPSDRSEVMARLKAEHLSVQTLRENPSDSDLARIIALYKQTFQAYTFDLTERNIRDVLDGENMVLVGRSPRREIVSILIAEKAEISIEGATLRMFELSDFATDREWRGKGFNTALQMEAIRQIRNNYDGDALIYAEDRAPWTAVNKSSRSAGLAYAGTLEQHCVMISDRDMNERGSFENLHVWVSY